MQPIPEPPVWVVPAFDEVGECYLVASRCVERGFADGWDRGVLHALCWLTIGEVSPMTHRSAAATSWENARAESWLALCVAAGRSLPTAEDWRRLGADPLSLVTEDRLFAYGVWRAFAWLLGVREDWPIYTARHRAAELPPERPYLYGRTSKDPAALRAAELAAWERAEADALAWWRHIRTWADLTSTQTAAG